MKSRCSVEKVLKIPFEEINLVRVQCKGCGDAAIEMPLSAMANCQLVCPGCGKDLRRTDVDKALTQLANGIMALQKHGVVGVRLVLSLGTD